MKKLLLLASIAPFLFSCGTDTENYEIIKNDLRAPAYPLVTIDPYTSAWSMSDNLYDSPVKHWTGKDFPLIGVIKVDGVSYRFMGTEDKEMLPIVPTSLQGDWKDVIQHRNLAVTGHQKNMMIRLGKMLRGLLELKKMSLLPRRSGEPAISGFAVPLISTRILHRIRFIWSSRMMMMPYFI